jgi:predicted RNA binding protein YcfA (HicA-like mRNA interferase family)
MLRIPDFQATFDPVTLTPISLGPTALDTLLIIHNTSSDPNTPYIGFWNEHEELVFHFYIALAGLDVQSFSVASMLHGDPRARLSPYTPSPAHPQYPPIILQQTLCRLSCDHPPGGRVDGVIINPIHGHVTVEDLDRNGSETSLRVDYFIGRPASMSTNPDARLMELTRPDNPPVVYSRPAWRGLGAVLKESQMKVREAIRLIESDGWYYVASKGSHRQYKHPLKQGRVTISGKLSDDLAPGTFNSILKQAGLKG